MNEAAVTTYADLILPSSVVSKVDVSRLVSEVERIDNELTTSAVRAQVAGVPQVSPTVSQQLAEFITQNNLSITDNHVRSELVKQLRELKDKVPVIHMTFAVTADPESLQRLVMWLRTSVHRQAVIAVGLQPGLIAGVYLRTPNHVHDWSLRGMLAGGHDLLVNELEALRGRS